MIRVGLGGCRGRRLLRRLGTAGGGGSGAAGGGGDSPGSSSVAAGAGSSCARALRPGAVATMTTTSAQPRLSDSRTPHLRSPAPRSGTSSPR